MKSLSKHLKRFLGITALSGILLVTQLLFGQSQFSNDCNLVLQSEANIPESFGFFDRGDIIHAFANMCSNCASTDACKTYTSTTTTNASSQTTSSNYKVLNSAYLYDHLLEVGFAKLSGNADKIGLQNDPSGLALKELTAKILAAATDPNITMTPASVQQQMDIIREPKGVYSESLAKGFGVYAGSTGLKAKYEALCHLARGLYFNTNVTLNKGGSTTWQMDQKLINSCIGNKIPQATATATRLQDGLLQKVSADTSSKLGEALNVDTHDQLTELLNTTQDAKNNFVDVSKKIDQPMQECNIN